MQRLRVVDIDAFERGGDRWNSSRGGSRVGDDVDAGRLHSRIARIVASSWACSRNGSGTRQMSRIRTRGTECAFERIAVDEPVRLRIAATTWWVEFLT